MTTNGLSINECTTKPDIPQTMKSLIRLAAIAVFIVIAGFCIFGFIATFEPMPTRDRVIWRTVYSLTGIACALGLFRLLCCQCRLWLKQRHRQSRLMLALGTTMMVTALTACTGPRHKGPYYYSVEPGTTYLSEEQAIAFAKETMVKEGFDLNIWQVERSDARRAPDKLVTRFPNEVRVQFTDGKKTREVGVFLSNGQVTSRMLFGL